MLSMSLQLSHDNEVLKSKIFTEDEDDDATLKTYGIKDGDEINVKVKQPTCMPLTTLTIRRFSGDNQSVCVHQECSIANLEDTVHQKLSLPSSKIIKLICGKDILKADGDSTLRTYGIEDGAELNVTVVDYIRVYKHIYRLEHGTFAALFKAGTLISTEEVLLHPNKTLREQWKVLEVSYHVYVQDFEADKADAIVMNTKEGDECLWCNGKGFAMKDEKMCILPQRRETYSYAQIVG